LTLSAAGLISGTPTAAGTSSFTVRVTDSASPAATATMALSLTITAAPAATVSLATQIQPIFTANCVTACHSPGGSAAFLNLTAGSSFAALVQSASPAVVPGSSATSRLYQRITSTTIPMPPAPAAPLSAANQTLIQTWINQGALDN
jgi:mono/diheme cytochrome c family protein